jgi:hypothetical protein
VLFIQLSSSVLIVTDMALPTQRLPKYTLHQTSALLATASGTKVDTRSITLTLGNS